MVRKRKKKADLISDRFIKTVCDRLEQGKRVRRVLPLGGRLHIDRTLPFLCVYRRPPRRQDNGTERLVMGEASYLIASGGTQLRKGLSSLVRAIAETLARECGAFLIIELWAARGNAPIGENGLPQPVKTFRLVASRSHLPTTTLERLENALKGIRIPHQRTRTEITYRYKRWPESFTPLLSAADARALNCFRIGLEVDNIYIDSDSGEVYPIVLRNLHHGLARAIKMGIFEFSHNQTTHRPANYQVVGRQAVVRAVWNVDRSLAEISSACDFLLMVTPINIDQAWNQFKRRRFERIPTFAYRPLPIDPALMKRTLYKIPIERIEDPTLAFLFREICTEIEQMLSMLRDRGTPDFLYGSMQRYGSPDDKLTELATEILQKVPHHSRVESRSRRLNAGEFAEYARAELAYYKTGYPALSSTVQIRDDITGLMVSKGNLLIGRRSRIPESRVDALLQHEIGTHVLTYFNGLAQPFQQLYSGLAGYDELQEGLAVLTEYLVGGLSPPRLRLLAGRVTAARDLTDGATFIETYRNLNREHGFDQRTSYSITSRIYRSGGLTKDAVYLRGLVSVLEYVKGGGDLEPLFVGKIAIGHIPIIRELQARQVLKPIPLRPRYLNKEQSQERLAHLRNGVSVLNLIDRRK